MLGKILDETQRAILARERRTLGDLRGALGKLGLAEDDQAALADSIAQLDELFLLVVVGEFNAGKSAFLNALLGEQLLAEGVTPTTSSIQWVRYGEQRRQLPLERGVIVIEAPLPMLREINLVDTPGTNAIAREHEALTRRFVPRSDLVLFVTSADRPFTESERAFLAGLREWGKKVIVAVNKIDILRSSEEVEQVRAFIAEACARLLGFVPQVFLLSARRAQAERHAHAAGHGEPGPASGLEALEAYIRSHLDSVEQVRLKLDNPLGVAQRLVEQEAARSQQQLEQLRDDFQALDDLQGQLGHYRADMEREFQFRLGDVDLLLHRLEDRGDAFFDETLRLGRIIDLMNKSRMRAEFERQVIADLPVAIERQVGDVIDWMVSSELRQWQGVRELVAKRQHQHSGRIVGEAGALDSDRRKLLSSLGQAAQRAVEGYDGEREAMRLAQSAQIAVAGAALLEVGAGAVGLGALLTAAVTSTAVEVTGILAAGTMAVLGLFVLPARRRRAKSTLRDRLVELRRRLMSGLSAEFTGEVEKSLGRLRAATAPYTRFVEHEREHLQERRAELGRLDSELRALRLEIAALR